MYNSDINMNTLMCPNCLNLLDVYVEVGVRSNKEFLIELSTPSIFYHCPECGKKVEGIYLDKEIADVIAIFNQKGYKTNFCCYGHNDEKKIDKSSRMYVIFETSFEDIIHSNDCIEELFSEGNLKYKDEKLLSEDNKWVDKFLVYYDEDDKEKKDTLLHMLAHKLPDLGTPAKFEDNFYTYLRSE